MQQEDNTVTIPLSSSGNVGIRRDGDGFIQRLEQVGGMSFLMKIKILKI